jgi:hypothetical protein
MVEPPRPPDPHGRDQVVLRALRALLMYAYRNCLRCGGGGIVIVAGDEKICGSCTPLRVVEHDVTEFIDG